MQNRKRHPNERGAAWLTPLEHTADAGFVVRAPTLAALFERAAAGLFGLLVDPGVRVAEREAIELSVTAADREALLVNWLSELNVLHQVRAMLFARVTVRRVSARRCAGVAFGEPFDPARHALRGEIKAVTYHGLCVAREGRTWTARVVFDV